MFNSVYHSKKVLVTGHTGFKGAWLSLWLKALGAEVFGFANGIPTQPSLFEAADLCSSLAHSEADIRDLEKLRTVIADTQPDVIFHLAAQSLVSESVADPIGTITTNALGTLNVLEAVRFLNRPVSIVIITSDKCYENVEWDYGYRENDALGGKDPYSASKACAEIIFHSMFRTYFRDHSRIKMATGRAGNVIGGGDWARDRIVPDCIRAWAQGETAFIRSPRATRPWQHVLEPLSGYLRLGQALIEGDSGINGESFNFGPNSAFDINVEQLVKRMQETWKNSTWVTRDQDLAKKEAGLLKLNCDKAARRLGWNPTLTPWESIDLTAEWYRDYYSAPQDAAVLTSKQLDIFQTKYAQAR